MSEKQLSIRDAKIDRLLRYKNLTSQDKFRINYIYEQRSSRNFWYNALNVVFWGSAYLLFFRGRNKTLNLPVLSGFAFLSFLRIKDRNNRVLDEKLDPFHEKYKIK